MQRMLAVALVAVVGGVMCLGVVPMANAASQNVTLSLHERILSPEGTPDTVGVHKVQAGGRISWDVNVSVSGPMFAVVTLIIPTGIDIVNMPSECAWEFRNATISCQLSAFNSVLHFDAVVSRSVAPGTVLKTIFEATNQVSSKLMRSTMTVVAPLLPPPTTPTPTPTATPTITPPSPPTIPTPPSSSWPNSGSGNIPVVISPPSSANNAAVSLQMTGHLDSSASGKVGDPVVFTFKILNTGLRALNSLTLSTGLTGEGAFFLGECINQGGSVVALESVELSPDTFLTCTGSSAVTQADLDAGQKVNSPTVVEAHVVDADATVRATSSGAVRLGQTPQLKLVSTASISEVAVGGIVSVTLTATNAGNVTLKSVTINASPVEGGDSSTPTLEPGKPLVHEFSYTLTDADVAAGKLHIEATVTGQTLPCPNEACGQGQTVTAIADSDLSLATSSDSDDDGAFVGMAGLSGSLWLVISGLIALGVIAVGVIIIRSRRAARLAKVNING